MREASPVQVSKEGATYTFIVLQDIGGISAVNRRVKMDFEIGVYRLAGLKIFWAILPDGSTASELGDDGLNKLLGLVVDLALRRNLGQRLRLYSDWLRENAKLTVIIEEGVPRAVRVDDALTGEALFRYHPDDLEREILGGHKP